MWGGLAPRPSNLLLNGRALRTARFRARVDSSVGWSHQTSKNRPALLACPMLYRSRQCTWVPCSDPQPLRKFFAIRLIIEHVEIGQQTCLIETNDALVCVG